MLPSWSWPFRPVKAPEEVPAVVHVDGSCRPQIVEADNARYFQLIQEFEKISGVPCLLNTSLTSRVSPSSVRHTMRLNFFGHRFGRARDRAVPVNEVHNLGQA